MAGDWIKMRNDLHDDPAVIAIAAALDLDEFEVVGRLHHLWAWADRQSQDGNAVGVTEKWIDRYVRCDGFAKCMVSVNWLSLTDSGISIPNFERHNGKSAKKRAVGKDRAARFRNAESNGDDVTTALPEKRREEKKNTTAGFRPVTDYPPEFESAWRIYPKRVGDNPKRRALKAWHARRAEGHTPEEMAEGVQRYAQFCRATGKTGTELVKQAATFFGPDKPFTETWRTAPKHVGGFVG